MSNQPNQSEKLREELINWLEQEPSLAQLRTLAADVVAEYKPIESIPEKRIRCNPPKELPVDKKGPLHALWKMVWVPGRSMRGNAYGTPELDRSLDSVAKLMCISTIWDFVCTIPLFSFSLTPLAIAALPTAILLSFGLMLASNVAGENSTDRRPGHSAKASWSLAAFVLLCTAKTLFSGVGVDLMIGSQAVASNYAAELAKEKLTKDKTELKRLEGGDAVLQKAANDCAQLKQQMTELDRNTNEKQYISLFVQAYGSNAVTTADRGLTNDQMLERYGSISKIPGACRQEKVIQEFNAEKAKPLSAAIERKSQVIASLPPLTFLKQEEPSLFAEHFRLADGKLEWVNGTEAVAEATDQFYSNLLSGRLSPIGFSLFMLSISVILTGSASILIYLVGRNPEVRASYTGELNKYRDERLNRYQQALQREV
jgi:hypothetical protein